MSQEPQPVSTAETVSKPLEPVFFVFFALFALVMLILPLRHSIELWDESRYANNAIEMALRGHWLTPTYNWTVDHWNTKPPLLVAIMAALYKLGLPPMMALRLPSEVCALSTVAVVFFFCRNVLRRPFVAALAALLLMSSTVFFGLHVAMSGDTDALLCLFTTLYTFGFFCFVEPVDGLATPGIAIAGIALALAVLDKSIAGVVLLPGLFLYALLRRRLIPVLRDRRLWLALLGVVAVIVLYYKGRDLIDPGYMHAVWMNELGGRIGAANEGHRARTLFYANYLVHHFEPGMILLVLGFVALRSPRGLASTSPLQARSRAAAILCGVVSLAALLALTKSETKIFYYCAPAIPLMSIFAALGIADSLPWLASRWHASMPRLQNAAFGLLLVACCASTALGLREGRSYSAGEEGHYGDALQQLRQQGIHGPVVLLDTGQETNAGFHNYDAIASYYAKQFTLQGMDVNIEHFPHAFPAGTWLVSCDDALMPFVQAQTTDAARSADAACLYGKTVAAK